MEAAIWGLLGVVIGALLSTGLNAWWQRRNWQLQELTKAYARMFQAGRREVGILKAMFGTTVFYSTSDEAVELFRRGLEMLGPKVDSHFMNLLQECWLLERDPEIRKILNKLLDDYESYRAHVWHRIEISKDEHTAHDKGTPEHEHRVAQNLKLALQYKGRKAADLTKELKHLRERVGEKYFHSVCGSPDGNTQDGSAT